MVFILKAVLLPSTVLVEDGFKTFVKSPMNMVHAVKYIINIREMTQFTTGFSGTHCVRE
jgi:hypothetical protein